MGLLRPASTESKRIELGEGDWIEVRAAIAKRDFNRFIKYMPNRNVSEETPLTPDEAVELQTGLFETLVTGWSAEMEPTVENYLALDRTAAEAVDAALAEHFNTLTPSKEEASKGFRSGKADR